MVPEPSRTGSSPRVPQSSPPAWALPAMLSAAWEKVMGEGRPSGQQGGSRGRAGFNGLALSDIWVLLSVGSVLITSVHSGVWLK